MLIDQHRKEGSNQTLGKRRNELANIDEDK
jgi:hypothetical protein